MQDHERRLVVCLEEQDVCAVDLLVDCLPPVLACLDLCSHGRTAHIDLDILALHVGKLALDGPGVGHPFTG